MACICPACGSGKSQVRDTDSKNYDVSVKRIRQCCDCSRRFETFESVDNRDIKKEVMKLSDALIGIRSQILKSAHDVLEVRGSLADVVL